MDPRDFYRPTTVPDSEIKHYCPLPRTRMLYAAMLPVGIGVILWLIRGAVWRAQWLIASVYFLTAVLVAVYLAYVLTVRVVIDARTITRSWLAGRRVIVLEDIRKLGFVQGKGSVSLVIRDTKKRAMSLSSNTFDMQDIRCMHRDILLAFGLDDEPTWPQSCGGHLGFLDVEQVLRYKHFKEESSKCASATPAQDQHLTYPPQPRTPPAYRD